MQKETISEKGSFYIRIETICKAPVVACPPDTEVVEAARLMKEHDVTVVAVVENGTPLGVFSLRDVRNLVADYCGAVAGCTLRNGMGKKLVTIGLRSYVFEAVLKMVRHNLYHLAVLDDQGMIVGIITATDLLKLHAATPPYLHQKIEEANSIEELQALGRKILDVVGNALAANTGIKNIVQLISGFNDAITLRLIALLEMHEGIRLPAGAAYLVLGSEGRGEQTLRTDQDNAIVFTDGMAPAKLREVERFADRLVEALVEIGVPRCPGNIMANCPVWRHSLAEWNQLVDRWITEPTPEHVLDFGMFQDLRPLHGDEALGRKLRDHIRFAVQSNAYFFPNMADHVVRFPAPFTILGRVRVEPNGEQAGRVDLKKSGIFAITAGASLLALECGVIGGTTWEKLELLGKRGIISGGDLETIEAAFGYLTRLRLQRQLQELSAGRQATNHVDPQAMTEKERDRFHQALRGVNTFLWLFRDHYNLDYRSI